MNHFDEQTQAQLCNQLKRPEDFRLTYNLFVEELNKIEKKYGVKDISRFFAIRPRPNGVVFAFTEDFVRSNSEIRISVLASMAGCGLLPEDFVFREV